ncbi:hypothetical protein ACFOWX_09615 [Sphingorhabdus arenilitoris]|uniref:Uncharacterized protein n=1 Tax=Sphingorhabdus arenilitoris TaxID=1490041 RepID=A0ABV8RH08_9SPHN
MTLTKALLIFALLVIAFNLFFYARFKRLMAEVRVRAEQQEAAAKADRERSDIPEGEQ